MTLGQGGLDTLFWEANGFGQFDVVLPPQYLIAPGGQSVQTFQFEGSILYDEVGLTCVSSTALNLSLRLAPAVDLTGEDTSGPVDDLVMCEGSDLTLNAFADQNGADETFSWQIDNGYPHQTNENDVYFIDVLPRRLHSPLRRLCQAWPQWCIPTTAQRLQAFNVWWNNLGHSPCCPPPAWIGPSQSGHVMAPVFKWQLHLPRGPIPWLAMA